MVSQIEWTSWAKRWFIVISGLIGQEQSHWLVEHCEIANSSLKAEDDQKIITEGISVWCINGLSVRDQKDSFRYWNFC